MFQAKFVVPRAVADLLGLDPCQGRQKGQQVVADQSLSVTMRLGEAPLTHCRKKASASPKERTRSRLRTPGFEVCCLT